MSKTRQFNDLTEGIILQETKEIMSESLSQLVALEESVLVLPFLKE